MHILEILGDSAWCPSTTCAGGQQPGSWYGYQIGSQAEARSGREPTLAGAECQSSAKICYIKGKVGQACYCFVQRKPTITLTPSASRCSAGLLSSDTTRSSSLQRVITTNGVDKFTRAIPITTFVTSGKSGTNASNTR